MVSILIFIAVLYIIGSIGNKKESDTASYSHSRYSSSYSTKSTTGSGSSYNSSTKKIQPEQAVQIKYNRNKQHKENNPYNSYDDGYDDIYMDDDYDYDRYYKDSDYADGVDDAMDDLDEDW